MESTKSKKENETNLDIQNGSVNNSKLDNDLSNNKKDSNQYDPSWLVGTSAEKTLNNKNNNKKKDFSHPTYKKLSKINGKINKMNTDELINSLKELKLDTRQIFFSLNSFSLNFLNSEKNEIFQRGRKEVLSKRLKSHYKETSLKSDNADESTHKTDKTLDYVCVIDFEATCTENKIYDYPHEIIQCKYF